MKTVRKLLSLILALAMIFAAGCAGNGTGKPEDTSEAPETSAPTEQATEEVTEEPTEEALQVESFQENKYRFEALKKAGAVRIVGRSEFLNDKMTVDWGGSGIILNVRTEGETMTVEYETSYAMYYSVEVDGVETAREFADGKGFIRIPLQAGTHTVSVLKDTEISIQDKSYSYLVSLRFGGEFLKAPADKSYYIEIIGDSIASGDGALGVFTPGVNYALADHSAKASFGYVAAEMLGADYSMVTRGGIGLLKARDELQRRMIDIYEYASPYNDRENLYVFSVRVPDLVILELGANDGGYEEYQFYDKLKEFIAQIRKVYGPDVPIVWFGSSGRFYGTMVRYMANVKNEDTNLYAFRFEYGRTGSAALATQTSGHPNAAEQLETAEKIFEFLKMNELIPTGE